MKIFLAGGVHSNIGPAYKRMVADNDISGDGFARALANENFWRGGERRHWTNGLHDASPMKEKLQEILSKNENFWQGSPLGGMGGVTTR